MNKGICQKSGCTVAESGLCLLSHVPQNSCPNYQLAATSPSAEVEETFNKVATPESATALVPTVAAGGRRFHTGLELGSEDLLELSRARYCHLIGILGDSGAGKTCFLLSLYLMACRMQLPNGYLFAGSLTLKGFEDRARHLRRWKGGSLPTKLADHTQLSDTREAALLHLALRKSGDSEKHIDLMLTDLPGEWSKSLIDSKSVAQRFQFLKRADGIILVVDGPSLDSQAKHVELNRLKHLLERIKVDVGVNTTVPITVLISKGDEISMRTPDSARKLVEYGQSMGFVMNVIVAAAFSNNLSFKCGKGVFEAIEPLLLTSMPKKHEIVKATNGTERRFAAFGSKTS